MKQGISYVLLVKDSLLQQFHFNGNIYGNKCCHCNWGSLYVLGAKITNINSHKSYIHHVNVLL